MQPQKVLERNKLDPEMVDYVIAHQANKRITDATQTRANLNKEILTNIEHYGNTTAATLPLLMRDFENQFKIGINYFYSLWRWIHVGICPIYLGVLIIDKNQNMDIKEIQNLIQLCCQIWST